MLSPFITTLPRATSTTPIISRSLLPLFSSKVLRFKHYQRRSSSYKQNRYQNPYQNQYTYKRFNNNHDHSNSTIWDSITDPANRKVLYFILGGGSLFYVTHLKEAPVSRRRRFIWIPRSIELMLGEYSYESILEETKQNILSQRHPVSRKVERIFAKIVEAAQRDPTVDKTLIKGLDWKIHVVDDPNAPPNAFVLPGGKVFVFSSILGICQNDDGIATVLSHEFAHQLARHTSESLSKAPFYIMVSMLLYAITGVQGINNLLTDGLLKMPASRQMETEADYIGLMVMSRACFNPSESVKVWQRMAAYEKKVMGQGASLEFLSTHPASERRIQNMTNWLGKANSLYEQSDCHAYSSYLGGLQDVFFNPPSSSGLF
ncbi:mitochondrial metalloendopeptidase Oma1p [Monosporozyma unispora]